MRRLSPVGGAIKAHLRTLKAPRYTDGPWRGLQHRYSRISYYGLYREFKGESGVAVLEDPALFS